MISFGRKKFSGRNPDRKVINIVSGLPRSGTSMMMKMLGSAGLKILTDDLRRADENNPKGYYEYEKVKGLKTGDFDWLSDAEGKVIKVISALLEYLPNSYNYKIIFMQRDMDEILRSQREMLIRMGLPHDKVSDDKMVELYSRHLLKVETWLEQQPNMDTLYISYNQIILNPVQNTERVNQFFGGNLDLGLMLQAVDQSLYRVRGLS
jgi:Sulfotransferase domain